MPSDLVRVDLDALYPPFVELVLKLQANCRLRGADYYSVSGFRTPKEQLKLWQKGRNAAGAVVDPKKVVTNVKFGAHNAGVAVDFCFDGDRKIPKLQPSYKLEDYRILAEEAQDLGLEAGFYWRSFKDGPHVQLPLEKHHITLTMLRGLEARGGIKAVWSFLDDNGPWVTI